jgi:predicted N-formylglutamate amidohydrolase
VWQSHAARPSDVFVIFECPHASNFVPREYPVAIAPDVLDSHEGYDPHVIDLMHALKRKFLHLDAAYIVSQISRLVVDHNRVPSRCNQAGLPPDYLKGLIADYHTPYIDTVFGTINRSITAKKFPILFNVHTYNSVLNGKERPLFSVGGDPNSEIVKSVHRHLAAQLAKPDIARQLTAWGLKDAGFLDFNGVYNLGPMHEGKENPMAQLNMAMRYGRNYGFPWVHLETRNDFAQLPPIQKIVAEVYAAVLRDPKVLRDWQRRRDRYYRAALRQIPRPVAPRPLQRPVLHALPAAG